jgi:outer membrane scaffolding protein for murein synthesis (MipA/OmpV family)
MRRLALPLALLSAPAAAQDAPRLELEKSVFDGDFLIVGAGPVAVPSYEGSDSLSLIPAAGVAGRIGGIAINPRAAGIALDLVPDSDKRVGFTLGPVLRYRTNRSGRIGDDVVARLGKLKGVLEGGVVAGVAIKRVLNPHDSLSASVDVRWDISGRGSGYIVSPGISYLTPVSRAQVVGLAATGNFVDTRYTRYNFSVTAAGAAASGLPVYDAKGGFKDWNLGVFTARDLDADFLNGGFAIAVGGMYSHLYGSAAASPVTRIRGRSSQWLFGGGLAYTF